MPAPQPPDSTCTCTFCQNSDGKILEENEEWDRSAILAIYGEDVDRIKEYEEELALPVAEGAEAILRDFIKKYPDRFDEIKNNHSMRSFCKWNGEYPVAFFVCSNGFKANYYVFKKEERSWVPSLEGNIEDIIKMTGIRMDSQPANFDPELYFSAAEKALDSFKQMLMDTQSGVEVRALKKAGKGGRISTGSTKF